MKRACHACLPCSYVSAGVAGRAVLEGSGGMEGLEPWQMALGLATTVVALGFVGHMAKGAIAEMEQEGPGEEQGKK